ncbi:hypothetical protein WMF04_00305 [Sorangium sp. So ce260]|uniref:hypothetical protein n=1 Tax=Sorangium sp. So ce260 TaxID=3133291 RepID=UPI003F5E9024
MKRSLIWGVLLAAIGSTGCQAVYTDIRHVDGNRYLITRNKAGPFTKAHGTVLDCQANGDAMTCTEVSDL